MECWMVFFWWDFLIVLVSGVCMKKLIVSMIGMVSKGMIVIGLISRNNMVMKMLIKVMLISDISEDEVMNFCMVLNLWIWLVNWFEFMGFFLKLMVNVCVNILFVSLLLVCLLVILMICLCVIFNIVLKIRDRIILIVRV